MARNNLSPEDRLANALDALPLASLNNMPALRIIRASQNRIGHLDPELFEGGEGLHTLELSDNELSRLPTTIAELSSLAILELAHNQLSELPGEIGRLDKLTILDVSHNPGLKAMPAETLSLVSLRRLNLSYTLVSDVPEVGLLDKLRYLNLAGTPIDNIPSEIFHLRELNHIVQP